MFVVFCFARQCSGISQIITIKQPSDKSLGTAVELSTRVDKRENQTSEETDSGVSERE